jgi:hypothetical protein
VWSSSLGRCHIQGNVCDQVMDADRAVDAAGDSPADQLFLPALANEVGDTPQARYARILRDIRAVGNSANFLDDERFMPNMRRQYLEGIRIIDAVPITVHGCPSEVAPLLRRPRNACVVCWVTTHLKCGRCRTVRYCSVECQLEAWPLHKEFCNRYRYRQRRVMPEEVD